MMVMVRVGLVGGSIFSFSRTYKYLPTQLYLHLVYIDDESTLQVRTTYYL